MGKYEEGKIKEALEEFIFNLMNKENGTEIFILEDVEKIFISNSLKEFINRKKASGEIVKSLKLKFEVRI